MNSKHDAILDAAFALWWDNLATGEVTTPGDDFDPDFARFALRLHTLARRAAVAPDVRQGLWRELMLNAPAINRARPLAPPRLVRLPGHEVSPAVPGRGNSTPGWRRATAFAATALLLVIAAGMIALFAASDGKPSTPALQAGPSTVTPAPTAMFTGKDWILGSAGLTTELLPPSLQTSFHATLLEMRVDAGSNSPLTVPATGGEERFAVDLVVDGVVRVIYDSSVTVTRPYLPAVQRQETIDPGQPVELQRGDSVMYRYDQGRSYVNLLASNSASVLTLVLTADGIEPLVVPGASIAGQGAPSSPSLAASDDCCMTVQFRLWNPSSSDARLPDLGSQPAGQYLIARASSGNPYFVYNVVVFRGAGA